MTWKSFVASAALASSALAVSTPAHAGFEPYVGDIVAYGFNFCPVGWFSASGQILPISQYEVLYALIGTTYGGDGQTTFALPDMRGRAVVGDGSSPFGTYVLGQKFGSEFGTVTTATMPAHTHTATLSAVPTNGNSNVPTGNSLARDDEAQNRLYSAGTPANNMNAGDVVIGSAGGSQPIDLVSPYLTMNYCIAVEGVFPPRP